MKPHLPRWPVLLTGLLFLAALTAVLEVWLPYYRQQTAIAEIRRLQGRVVDELKRQLPGLQIFW